MEAINLDAMSVEELHEIMKDPSHDGRILKYALNKAIAMELRASGSINCAKWHEYNCDRIYDDLPDELKW